MMPTNQESSKQADFQVEPKITDNVDVKTKANDGKKGKKMILIAVGVVVILALIIGIVIWLRGSTPSEETAKENPYQASELSLADDVLEWLNGRRTAIGLQADLNTCHWYSNRNAWFCQTGLRSHRAFFAPMWANVKYHEATADLSALNRVKNNLQSAKRHILDDDGFFIQNNNYDCLYMDEILTSPILDNLSAVEKETVKELCLSADFEVPVAENANRQEAISEINRKLGIIAKGGRIDATPYQNDAVWTELAMDEFVSEELAFRQETAASVNRQPAIQVTEFDKTAFYRFYLPEYYLIAGDHFYRYRINQKEQTLDQALDLLNKSLTIYLAGLESHSTSPDEFCALNLAINAAKDYITADLNWFNKWLSIDTATCALATYKAGKFGIEEQYQLYQMVESDRATVGNLPSKNFYVGPSRFDNVARIVYPLSVENGIFAGLLSIKRN